ncbi:hypothetical protein N8Z76_00275 [Gammaproteobacteria bacterium]|nr:hypothetical protein [Gammaproteobacteria bacterium]
MNNFIGFLCFIFVFTGFVTFWVIVFAYLFFKLLDMFFLEYPDVEEEYDSDLVKYYTDKKHIEMWDDEN